MNSVIYPPTISTDFERLCAVYPLIEQMRLEHNRVAELARSNPDKYLKTGKFRTYAKESKSRLKKLLAERNRLMENIRWANYTPEQWKDIGHLSEEEQDAIYRNLFGDKESEAVKPTEATSPLLDELKALDIDSLGGIEGTDPTEDLTTYTEVDPNGHLSKTSDRVTISDVTRDEACYIYKDKGVDHFDGDFEHLLKCYMSSIASAGTCNVWSLANDINDAESIKGASGSLLSFDIYQYLYYLRLTECDSGTSYYDTWTGASQSVVYYVEVERDEGVGSYGTLYAYICTGDYWDNGGTQKDTLSIALHTSKKDFRYIYAAQSYDTGNSAYTASGYMELLDLQEAGVTAKESSDSGSGAESSEETAALSKSETGSGVEQSLLSYLLSSSDSGSGVEVAALIAVLMLGDSGTGSDVSMLPWLEAIFGGDEGSGFDALKALIETTGSGSDMRLHGRTGKVRIPSKGVNL